jgi:D-cysteine desulfhydrase family pyridoxal phosphate-dependent enzyme
MKSKLDRVPRQDLIFLPTPLVALERLTATLRGPRLYVKRDDLTGLGLGGNKTRKLEFLLGEALSEGCDCVITGGAMQSNHSRQTAAAAAAVGLRCHLALAGQEPESLSGNLLLDRLFGAVVHWCGAHRKGEDIPRIAQDLHAQGHKPYIIPYGGSDPVGAMGFVAAMGELKEQLAEQEIEPDAVVFASSSGGTQAGMVVGRDLFDLDVRVIGIGVDKGEAGDMPYEAWLATLADGLAARLGLPEGYANRTFDVRKDYVGAGYGVVGDLEREAISLAARREGLLLDPVYTGRAMGGLIDLIRKGEFDRSQTVVFWHTGGTPALFAYADALVPRP